MALVLIAWTPRANGILLVRKLHVCVDFSSTEMKLTLVTSCFNDLMFPRVFLQRSSCSGLRCVWPISARWPRTWCCTAPRSSPSSHFPTLTGLSVFVKTSFYILCDIKSEMEIWNHCCHWSCPPSPSIWPCEVHFKSSRWFYCYPVLFIRPSELLCSWYSLFYISILVVCV